MKKILKTSGNHFNLFNWKINVTDYTMKEIEADGYAKSVFLHEYIHYCQTLSGSIGRVLLMEYMRILLRLGLNKRYNNKVPENFEQIDLLSNLKLINKKELKNTKEKKDFEDITQQLKFALKSEFKLINTDVDPEFPFIFYDYKISEIEITEFPHFVYEYKKNNYDIILSELVLFENMARAIQRQYLYYLDSKNQNNNFISKLNSLRRSAGEIHYVCLYDYLKSILPSNEDTTKWLITLCQFSIMCGEPGKVLCRLINLLINFKEYDIDKFIKKCSLVPSIKSVINQPPLQENVNYLINDLGSCMRTTENEKLKKLLDYIINLHNSCINNYRTFYQPVWEIDHLRSWIMQFGCPPIITKEGTNNRVYDIEIEQPWHEYLEIMSKLLN